MWLSKEMFNYLPEPLKLNLSFLTGLISEEKSKVTNQISSLFTSGPSTLTASTSASLQGQKYYSSITCSHWLKIHIKRLKTFGNLMGEGL